MAPSPRDNWADFIARLKAFRKKHGDCDVPTNYPDDPQLGRWLAMQRHKRKIGQLSPERAKSLDAQGVIWAPADVAWEKLFKELCAYKKKHGNCAVPTKWPKNIPLADWVQRQRIWLKKGKLKAERVAKLDSVGFSWAIYKATKDEKPAEPKNKPAPKPQEEADTFSNERLYRLNNGTFVQFDGKGDPPSPLQKYAERNRGDFPPYIPLPNRSVTFTIGEPWGKPVRLAWKGRGKLPAKVLDFVQAQGALPQYS